MPAKKRKTKPKKKVKAKKARPKKKDWKQRKLQEIQNQLKKGE